MIFKCSIKDKYGKGNSTANIFCLNRSIKKKYVTEVKASLFPIDVTLEAEG